jgi:uncharacterized membrane protein YgaE (UPF0421/DUF939 family)
MGDQKMSNTVDSVMEEILAGCKRKVVKEARKDVTKLKRENTKLHKIIAGLEDELHNATKSVAAREKACDDKLKQFERVEKDLKLAGSRLVKQSKSISKVLNTKLSSHVYMPNTRWSDVAYRESKALARVKAKYGRKKNKK